MAVVVPNESNILMLQLIIGGERLLRLFSNNLNPSKTTVIDDIEETTIDGYEAITLEEEDWVLTSTLGVNKAQHPMESFTLTNSGTVYGYYVTTIDNELLWIERFATAPYNYLSEGGEVEITAVLKLN